jgi:hypothetical protein
MRQLVMLEALVALLQNRARGRSQTTTDLRRRALYGVAADACDRHAPEARAAVAHSNRRSRLDEPLCWPGLQAYARRRLHNRALFRAQCAQASSVHLAQQAYRGRAADDRALTDRMDPGDPGRASPR